MRQARFDWTSLSKLLGTRPGSTRLIATRFLAARTLAHASAIGALITAIQIAIGATGRLKEGRLNVL